MRQSVLALVIFIAAMSSVAAQERPAIWATDSTAPCAGITLPINANAAKLQAVVGPRWRVVPSKDGTASASLFVTECPKSTVRDQRVGPTTIAALILAVESRADSAGAARAPVVPVVFADPGAPVAELFRAYAFVVRGATVTLHVDSAVAPRRVTFAIATSAGRIEGSAIPADSSVLRSVTSRLFGTDPTRSSDFSGPESMRRSSASATVRVWGNTLLSELGVVAMPTTALYDAEFGWRFEFQVKE